MKLRFSLLKIAAWTIIGVWLTRSMIFKLVNIDFASMEIARNFRQVWLFLIPLAVATLMVTSWKEGKSKTKRIIELSAGILISTASIIVIHVFSGFCEWQFSEPIYKHKIENTEIRVRIHNCGAWDSDPSRTLVKTYSIGTYLIKYSEIKKEAIDNGQWLTE